MDDVRGSRIDEFAGYLVRVAVFLELHAEVGRVGRVLLVLAEVGLRGVEQPDRRIVAGDEFIRGVLLDPREDAFALRQEDIERRSLLLRVPGDAEGVGPVFAVGRPCAHLPRVEAGLRARDRGAGDAGRLAGDGVGAVRVGEVVMEGDPQARASAGRAAGEGDLGLVEVPLLGLAARELKGAGLLNFVCDELIHGQLILISLLGVYHQQKRAPQSSEDRNKRFFQEHWTHY